MTSQALVFEQKASQAEALKTAESEAPPVRYAEWLGRLIIAMSLAALLTAVGEPRLEQISKWIAGEMQGSKELRIIPRLSVFLAAGLFALIIQGARASRKTLFFTGGAALLLSVCLLPEFARPENFSGVHAQPAGSWSLSAAGNTMLLAARALQLARFELALVSAVLLGSWLGRDIRSGSHLVSMLLCAIVGDVWLSGLHIAESVPMGHPLTLMRMSWPPPAEGMVVSPLWTDLFFLSATFEAGRRLKLHMVSVVLGAIAGYTASAFLALEPWPAWPFLSMLMFSSGVLVASWPDMTFGAREIGRGFLLASTLLLMLAGLTLIQRKLNPEPPVQIDISRLKNVT